MERSAIIEKLRSHFGAAIGEWHESKSENRYQQRMGSFLEIVEISRWREMAFFLRDELHFNALLLLSSLDNGNGSISAVYHIESTTGHYELALHLTVPAENAHIPSVTDVWAHANWQEREAWDMMGIQFDGHPDHRRMLLEDDYPGHPLRKDFKEPEFYHGMKVAS